MSKRIKNLIEDFTPESLPELISPHIELCADRHAVVNGCKGILEYNSCRVRLNCGAKVLVFSGCNLCITTLYMEQITVSGKIHQINFE